MILQVEINVITSKDVASIFHVTQRTAQRQMALLRDAYGLSKHAVITLERFCDYYEIDPKDIHIVHKTSH